MSKSEWDIVFGEYHRLINSLRDRSRRVDKTTLASSGFKVIEPRRLPDGQLLYLYFIDNTLPDETPASYITGGIGIPARRNVTVEVSAASTSLWDGRFNFLTLNVKGSNASRIHNLGLTNTTSLDGGAYGNWISSAIIRNGAPQPGAADNLRRALDIFEKIGNGNVNF